MSLATQNLLNLAHKVRYLDFLINSVNPCITRVGTLPIINNLTVNDVILFYTILFKYLSGQPLTKEDILYLTDQNNCGMYAPNMNGWQLGCILDGGISLFEQISIICYQYQNIEIKSICK